jgi:hypothetical protein
MAVAAGGQVTIDAVLEKETDVAVPAPIPAPAAPANGLLDVPFRSSPPGALVSFSGMAVCYTP